MIVYKITNKITGKSYIGSTTRSLNIRKKEHIYKSNNNPQCYIHKSIRKYGNLNFKWEVLVECNNRHEMYNMEYHFIKQYNTVVPNGYNLTEGYDNTTLGYTFSDESRKAQSMRMMGSGNPNYGVKWTDKQKQHLSNLNKGNLCGDKNPSKRPEVREKIRQSKLGKNNPNAKKWLLISPKGIKIEFKGGIKRKMKELGLSYDGSLRHRKGLVDNYKGWIITNETL